MKRVKWLLLAALPGALLFSSAFLKSLDRCGSAYYNGVI